MKVSKNKIIKYSLLLLILSIGFVLYLCHIKKSKNTFYQNSEEKIWAHRGLSLNCQENSINSIDAALNSGFRGVEIDIWYNEKLNSFEVKHDSLKQVKILFLKTILQKHKVTSLRFWLDLKNLTSDNVEQIIDLLNTLNKDYSILGKVIIESPKAKALNCISKAGYYTSLYLKPLYNIPLYIKLRNNIINMLNLCFYDYSAASMTAKAYTGINRILYKNKNIHLWLQTKDKKALKKWTEIKEVKIVLFDGKL